MLLTPFTLEVKPSRIWLAAMLLVWCALAATVMTYMLWFYYVLLPVAAWLAVHAVRQNGWWGSKERIHQLRVDSSGQLFIGYSIFEVEAQLADDCFVTPWLTVLNVIIDDDIKRSFIIWPDSAMAEGRRQLRVYIRWFRTQAES